MRWCGHEVQYYYVYGTETPTNDDLSIQGKARTISDDVPCKVPKICIPRQKQTHVDNGRLRAWLGLATECDSITQTCTTCHAQRTHAYSNTCLESFFPGCVGAPMQVGRLVLVNGWLSVDRKNTGIPLRRWIQLARRDQGSERPTNQVARWLPPKAPQQAVADFPNRSSEGPRHALQQKSSRLYCNISNLTKVAPKRNPTESPKFHPMLRLVST